MRATRLPLAILLASAGHLFAPPAAPLPGTAPLTNGGDFSVEMVEGLDRWLGRETERAATNRARFWQRDFNSRSQVAPLARRAELRTDSPRGARLSTWLVLRQSQSGNAGRSPEPSA